MFRLVGVLVADLELQDLGVLDVGLFAILSHPPISRNCPSPLWSAADPEAREPRGRESAEPPFPRVCGDDCTTGVGKTGIV